MWTVLTFLFAVFKFVLYVILWLIVLFLLFSAFTSVDFVTDFVKCLFKKIKKCYEYIRQHVCKKGNEVNDDSRAIHDSTEFYDSSSVWED